MTTTKRISAMFLTACLIGAFSAEAANRSARVSGNWNQNIWSSSNNCTGGLGASTPGAADDVFICNGVTVTLNSARTVDSIRIFSGGTLNGSSNTLTIDNTVAFTLDAGGNFNPQTGTVLLNRNGNTTVVSGTASAITFNNLTIAPSMNGNRTYTLSAGSIRGITVAGNFNVTPPSAGGTRTLTINDGVLTNAGGGIVVGGALTLNSGGNEPVNFNTGNVDMTFGRLVLGGGGSGNNTFIAGSSIVTLNGSAGPLLDRNGNGVFNDGTSTVVMNSGASVDLISGDFTRPNNSFNNFTVDMPGQTGRLDGDLDVNSSLVVSGGTLSNEGFPIDGGGAGTFQVNNGAGFNMTGASVFPTNFSTYTFLPTSTVRYLQSVARNIELQPWGHLVVGPAANGVAHTFPDGTTTVAGDLTIGNGVNSGTSTAATNDTTLDVNGAVSILANATLVAHADNPFTVHGDWSNSGTFNANDGTVTLDGTAAQAIGGTSATTFDELTLQNTTAAVTAGISIAVEDTLTLVPGTTLADGGQVITVSGDVDNAGQHVGSGKIELTGGSAEHQLSGSGTYANLELDDAFGAALAANATVGGTLMLTTGTLDTGPHTLVTTADCPGSVTQSGGWVAGSLQMRFPLAGPPDCTFHIGDDVVNYAPVRLDFSAVTTAGSLTASVVDDDHPNTIAGVSGIEGDGSINRFWTLRDSTVAGTYTATFTYADPGDHDAGVTPAAFRVRRGVECEGDATTRTCTPWTPLSTSGTPNATQASAAGTVTADGGEADFIVGEADPATNFQRERQFIYTRELY